MNEYEKNTLREINFVEAEKEPEIKRLDFSDNTEQKSKILERSALLVQSLRNLGIACGSMSQAKKVASEQIQSLKDDEIEVNLALDHSLPEDQTEAESTLNAPVAHSEWGTAGIGSSDDGEEEQEKEEQEQEEQEQEEQLEGVVTGSHTEVDESFFVDGDSNEEEAPDAEAVAPDVHVAVEENPDEFVFAQDEEPAEEEVSVTLDATQTLEEVAVEAEAPESATDDLTVPGVADDEPVYESFIPASDIEVPAHVEAEFNDVLPFLAPSPVEPVEEVEEPGATALEIFDAAVFAPVKVVTSQLDRQIRVAKRDSVSPVRLEFMTDDTHARFYSLETRELNARRIAYNSFKELSGLADGLKEALETLDFVAIEKFKKILNKASNYKRLADDLELSVREVMRRSQKRWGK